jgi:hypothetical protein
MLFYKKISYTDAHLLYTIQCNSLCNVVYCSGARSRIYNLEGYSI